MTRGAGAAGLLHAQPGSVADERRPSAQAASPAWTAIFTVVLFASVSRGLFEIAVGKQLAYALQLGVVGSFVALLILFGRPSPRDGALVRFLVADAFVVVAVLSGLATAFTLRIEYFTTYIAVMVVYVGLLTVFGALRFDVTRRIAFGPATVLVAGLLAVVALLQQYRGLVALPGSDAASMGGLVRPASLTGSYLHYPLALGLLTFAMGGLYQRTGRRYLLVAAIAAACAVVVSFSRSGMLIIVAGAAAFLVIGFRGMGRVRAGLLALVVGLGLVVYGSGSVYFGRALSAIDAQGAGNATRIAQWRWAVETWLDSPVLVGSRTGTVTNVTANFSQASSGVVESGVLQQLVNFGLLGVIAFYAVMFLAAGSMDRRASLARAGMYGAIVESAFYQSIEVFPFMVLLALMVLMFPMPPRAGPTSAASAAAARSSRS